MQKQKAPRLLDVKISDEDRIQAGVELADLDDQIELKEDKRKADAKAAANEIEELEVRKHDLKSKVRTGTVKREVLCFERISEEDPLKIEVVRDDTGEVIDWREATGEDLQTDLDLDTKPGAAPDGIPDASLPGEEDPEAPE